MSKRIVCILLSLIILLSVSGCNIEEKLRNPNELQDNGEDEEFVETQPNYGGEITVPILHVKSLNPLLSSDRSLYYFNKFIFEGLFDIDEQMNIKNVLAEEYNIEGDGKTVNIKLRENVIWHDGENFTSDDVKFTVDVMKFAYNSQYARELSGAYKISARLLQTADVKITDRYNLKITSNYGSSDIIESLIFPIIPKHKFLGNKPYENALSSNGNNLVGTGPYKKTEYNKLKSVVLQSNEDYWNGKPYIDKIAGRVLNDDDLSLISFESGQVDVTTSQGVDWEKYAQNKNVRIYEYASQQYEFLGFNFRKELFMSERGRALRKAIAYGIDRQSIIQKVYLGHATQIDVPIHPDSWLVSDDANSYGYNVNKAKETLEAAGWADNNGDGIYEDAEGNKLSIKLTTNSYNDLRRKTANIIAQNLRNIGIEVIKDYNESETENVTEEMSDKQWQEVQNKLTSGSFDVILLGWDLSYSPDLSFAFHSSQVAGGTNFIAYQNPEMDVLLNETSNTVSREQKKQVYEKIQKNIIEELPYVSLFFVNNSILANKKIKGEITPSTLNIYNNIDKWYIPEAYQDTKEKE
jgi:peptide/nickel transport system substrate-binding protein